MSKKKIDKLSVNSARSTVKRFTAKNAEIIAELAKKEKFLIIILFAFKKEQD